MKSDVMKALNSAVDIGPVEALHIKRMQIKLVGDSPLICHAWSQKAKGMMRGRQTGRPVQKTARVPFNDYTESLYWMSPKPERPTDKDIAEAIFGFPATGFKASAIEGSLQVGKLRKKTEAQGAFHIMTDLVQIDGAPKMREDVVRIGPKEASKTDLRYRGEFTDWTATLKIAFNPNAVDPERLIRLFENGGYACGIGEWRPSRGGHMGMYHVDRENSYEIA